jgi:hypothetical protein
LDFIFSSFKNSNTNTNNFSPITSAATSAARQPAKQPAAKQPAAMPAAKQPAAKQPAAKQPAAKPAATSAATSVAKPVAKLVVDMNYDFKNLQQDFKKKLFDNYSVMFKEYEKKVFSRDENNFLELSTKKERDVNIKKILLTDGDNILNVIQDIRESYIIIDFLCYSDTLLENKLIALILNKENTGLDKIVQFSSELDENKSIALINNDEKYNENYIKNKQLTDNNIKDIHNYVYFLDSSSSNTNNNDNSNVLLIWKFNIYRIVNLDYKKGNLTDDFKIKRIKIYILYRLFIPLPKSHQGCSCIHLVLG